MRECVSVNDKKDVLDRGPFFHGTKAELKIGDLLETQYVSNYQTKKSNHIYFTATLDAAKWGAELATSGLKERIYLVERSEEHTSELQSRGHLVCRLLLEIKY